MAWTFLNFLAHCGTKAPNSINRSITNLQEKKKKEKAEEKKKEVFSATDLFASIGKKQAEKVLKDICSANGKWVHVVENHAVVVKNGVDLEFDTLLRGMLLPMDYNKVIREAIDRLKPRRSR